MTLRTELLKIASGLPAGDPTRRDILAAVKAAGWGATAIPIKVPLQYLSAKLIADAVGKEMRGSDILPDTLKWGSLASGKGFVSMPFMIDAVDAAGRSYEIEGMFRVMVVPDRTNPYVTAQVMVNR